MWYWSRLTPFLLDNIQQIQPLWDSEPCFSHHSQYFSLHRHFKVFTNYRKHKTNPIVKIRNEEMYKGKTNVRHNETCIGKNHKHTTTNWQTDKLKIFEACSIWGPLILKDMGLKVMYKPWNIRMEFVDNTSSLWSQSRTLCV